MVLFYVVLPPEIDTFEFIVGEVLLEVPAGVAGRYLDKIKVKKHQAKSTSSSSALPSPASPSQPNSPPNQTKSLLKSLPNVDLQLKRITISVADRLYLLTKLFWNHKLFVKVCHYWFNFVTEIGKPWMRQWPLSMWLSRLLIPFLPLT